MGLISNVRTNLLPSRNNLEANILNDPNKHGLCEPKRFRFTYHLLSSYV